MTTGPACRCLLCRIELQLTADVTSANVAYRALLSSAGNGLRAFASPLLLLSHLRSAHADPRSDELFRELFAARPINGQFVETIIVLAFLPVLHHTVSRVVKQQPGLSYDDVTQQALSFFLQFLRSESLQRRESHFAFAISRAVKRQMFEWANREGGFNGARTEDTSEILNAFAIEEPLERYALLRHFLHRCVTKGLLSGAELDLLVQIKLDGNTGDAECSSLSSNARRQKTKRLLAKLRRLAK